MSTASSYSLRDRDGFRPELNVLIADDHVLLRRGLREFLHEFLEKEGRLPSIVETGSAEEAISQVRTAAWDLVILDLNLPDMPGLELLRVLKSLRPTIAVLVLSIYAEEHYAARALRAGATGYLTKKSGPEQLRATIGRILHRRPSSHQPAEGLDEGALSRRPPYATTIPAALSDREMEVLQWIAQGRRLTHIAEHLHLSIKTVSTYRTRLLTKLGMKSTAELIRYALDQQLV